MHDEWEYKLRREVMKTRHLFAQTVEEVSQEIHSLYCDLVKEKSLDNINWKLDEMSKKG